MTTTDRLREAIERALDETTESHSDSLADRILAAIAPIVEGVDSEELAADLKRRADHCQTLLDEKPHDSFRAGTLCGKRAAYRHAAQIVLAAAPEREGKD